jgi:3-methyladenine DNA glycosylase AlkD
MISEEIRKNLQGYIKPERAAYAPKYFKAQKGQYGEGDQFLGISVPDCRKVAKQFLPLVDQAALQELFDSQWHEERLTALFILVALFKKSKNATDRKFWLDYYLMQLGNKRVNNWDLVDSSAYHILGEYLLMYPEQMNILTALTVKQELWSERCAVVATLAFIRKDIYDPTITLCSAFLTHKHDLIHKACGWMLREIGDRNPSVLISFLDDYAPIMPRTMLRYALEKLPVNIRVQYKSNSRK